MAQAKATGKAVEIRTPEFDVEQLAGIQSFDDATVLFSNVTGEGVTLAHEEMGDGFALLADDARDSLIGIPLFLMTWEFRPGDYDDEYVTCRLVARNENGTVRKVLANFGGSGVYEQIRDFTDRSGRVGGLLVKHGLRRSDFWFDPKTKKASSKETPGAKPARTYYLDLSA